MPVSIIRLLLIALVLAAPAAQAQYQREPTRQAMQAIFGQLQTVLPLSVDLEAFRDPSQAEKIRKALGALADSAQGLDQHGVSGPGLDPGGRYMARSLERDARRALEHFERGRFDSAEFFVGQLAESCVGCHARLPSPGDAPLARGFAARADLTRLDPLERARLAIATRQFEEALSSLEAAFESQSLAPFELLGPLTDYLTLCVRVVLDPARPVPVLEKLARRGNLWVALRSDVEAWAHFLSELGARKYAGDPVAEAEKLIGEGRSLILFPSDRRALIHYLFASKLLHTHVATQRVPGPGLARAYYLLGVAESRIGPNFWISQAEFYLEGAIRMAPETESAREAYALLEEEAMAGYTGSGGLQMPEDVEAHLRDLRELLEGARPRML